MDIDLGFDLQVAKAWFCAVEEPSYLLVRIPDEQAEKLAEDIAVPLRRSYATDALLERRSRASGTLPVEVLEAKLPDPGAVMSGDFGEILVFLFESTRHLPTVPYGPKKWRLKQDRTKPVPGSDLIHFVLPHWPDASGDDVVICTEVKALATAGGQKPIPAAIRDAKKDRTSRLARTLAWLEERALGEDLGEVKLDHIRRFTSPDEHPQAEKVFQAAAVICSSLVEQALEDAPATPPDHCSVIVVVVPGLKQAYSSAYEAARASASALELPEMGEEGHS